jgi:colicin import membrane protein
MDELRESSLLFSLEGLLETERERVQREAREAQKRRDEEMIRVAEQASRLRLATQQEREARERREALEQERARLEQERIDAMKNASVERARIEAEGQLRLIELEQVRKHDLALSQLRERQLAARYRTLTWLSSTAFALSVAGGLTVYLGWIRPAEARQLQHLQGIIDSETEQAKASQRALTSERSLNRALSARVEQLQAELAVAPNVAPEPKLRPAPSRPPGGIRPPRPKHCVDNGDPIDGCIH